MTHKLREIRRSTLKSSSTLRIFDARGDAVPNAAVVLAAVAGVREVESLLLAPGEDVGFYSLSMFPALASHGGHIVAETGCAPLATGVRRFVLNSDGFVFGTLTSIERYPGSPISDPIVERLELAEVAGSRVVSRTHAADWFCIPCDGIPAGTEMRLAAEPSARKFSCRVGEFFHAELLNTRRESRP